MLKTKLRELFVELKTYSSLEKLFILFVMFSAFCMTADYSIIRPASNSFFLTNYGAAAFPWAWLSTIPLNLLFVFLYNRFLPRLGVGRMFLAIAALIASCSLFFAFTLKTIWLSPFFLYVWKEIYIMVVLQQLWSMIHATINVSRAKYLYGIIFACGGIGSTIGSLAPSLFAVSWGSEKLLFLTLPLYVFLAIFFFYAAKLAEKIRGSSGIAELKTITFDQTKRGIELIKGSKVLLFILFIVVLMQFSATFIDFQFHAALEKKIPDLDLRTAYSGRLSVIIGIATISFQLIGSYIFIYFLGLRKCHLAVPCFFLVNSLLFFFFPEFPIIGFFYVAIKSIDFSFFGVIRELLYIPLKIEEKFQAKAVIDVFVYRTAKALASVFIMLIHLLLAAHLLFGISLITVLIFLLWSVLVYRYLRTDEAKAFLT